MKLRPATAADAPGIHAIYAPVVRGSAISFEEETPSVEEMEARLLRGGATYPWLVAEAADKSVAGYAYACSWRSRAAYRWTCEVSVYVAAPYRRRGLARRLYAELFQRLRAQGYLVAYAGVTLPNEPSVEFHEALGFEPVGVFPRCGFKHDAWWDVGFWRLELVERPDAPAEPRPPAAEEAAC